MYRAFFPTSTTQDQTLVSKPYYFANQFKFATEYAISGWLKWTAPASTPTYNGVFRISDVSYG
jgi:hypothetical protein